MAMNCHLLEAVMAWTAFRGSFSQREGSDLQGPGKPYVDQSGQGTAQLLVGSSSGPPEIDDPKQGEQKPANLPSVNTGGLKSTLETLESNPDPPKTTQVTQSGQEPTHLSNCKSELMSYSEIR
ncbi:hypothetical protein DSO57_1004226 [Entomophthora muscae]|uniref:Uncharacterized protein n=1 Tax=Entomophthora muscae TaxID=34485 RepID=A0ACC2RN27_9FUNG|nr:hypothetical protein DSO57_1004226 [Entomophthora muscae]